MDSKPQKSTLKSVKRPYAFDPCFLLIYLGFYLASAIIQNQILIQSCLTSGFNSTICGSLQSYKLIEKEVQTKASEVNSAIVMLNSVFPPIYSLLLGAWSDIYGRKPIMMMSFMGYSSTLALFTIFTYISDHIISLTPWVLFYAEIPMALMGGWPLLDVAASCFITDTSDKSKHSIRLGSLTALNMAMSFIANMSSSYIVEATNSTILFLISFFCCIIGFLIVIFVVEESIQSPNDAKLKLKFKAVFSSKVFLDIWHTLCKQHQHQNYRRRILWSLIAIVVSTVFTLLGSSVVLYLSGRIRFGWELKDFTTFSAASTGITAVGILITFVITKFIFKLSDFYLGLITLSSAIIEAIVYATATRTLHMYIGAAFGSVRLLSIPVFKSIMSNIFPQHEIAKIYSATTALEAFSGFASGPIYTATYQATINTFPGAFFLISTALFTLSGVLAVLINIWRKRMNGSHQNSEVTIVTTAE